MIDSARKTISLSRTLTPRASGIALVMLVLFSCTASADTASADGDIHRITFAITLPTSLLGKGAAVVWDDLLQARDIAAEHYGLDISFIKRRDWHEVVNALESGDADAACMPPYYYAAAKHRNAACSIRPLAVFSTGGSPNSRTCFFRISPGGPESADQPLDSLYGSRLAFPDESQWILLNLIFHQSGYRFEPYYFFQSIQLLNNESATLAMLFGEIDTVLTDETSMIYVRRIDPRLEDVGKVKCARPLPNTMIATADNMPAGAREKLLELLSSLHSDPAFAPFIDYFAPSDGHWTPADYDTFSPWTFIYALAARRGWNKAYDNLPLGE